MKLQRRAFPPAVAHLVLVRSYERLTNCAEFRRYHCSASVSRVRDPRLPRPARTSAAASPHRGPTACRHHIISAVIRLFCGRLSLGFVFPRCILCHLFDRSGYSRLAEIIARWHNDLTRRWSERRTAVRPHFEMTSPFPLRATLALVRRRSSCSR